MTLTKNIPKSNVKSVYVAFTNDVELQMYSLSSFILVTQVFGIIEFFTFLLLFLCFKFHTNMQWRYFTTSIDIVNKELLIILFVIINTYRT